MPSFPKKENGVPNLVSLWDGIERKCERAKSISMRHGTTIEGSDNFIIVKLELCLKDTSNRKKN